MTLAALDELRRRSEQSARAGLGELQKTRTSVWNSVKRLADRIIRDNLSLVAAGVAFYALLAIFPGLAVFVSIYGLVADLKMAHDQANALAVFLPAEATTLLMGALTSLIEKNTSELNVGLVVGLALALWSARAGMTSLMTGLNIAYDRTEHRSILEVQVIALALTAGAILFGILALLAIAAVPLILSVLPIDTRLEATLLFIRWPILTAVTMLGCTLIYYLAPCHERARWTETLWGAAAATVLWLIGSALFSVYVSRFGSYDATYGSLGAVVVLLLWLWLSALALLIGAEINNLWNERPSEKV